MPRKPEFPMIIRDGSIQARIYLTPSKGRDLFTLVYWNEGKRVRKTFADPDEARAEGKDALRKLAAGEVLAANMSPSDVASYSRALHLLKSTGMALETAVADYVEAHRKLDGRSLREAVEYYHKRNPVALPRKLVSEVVAEMLAAKEADKLSEAHRRDLKIRLERFAESFAMPIAEVSAANLNGYLRGLDCGGRSRNNYRNAIRNLFAFAVAQGFLAKDHIDFNDVARARETAFAIEIFTPEEMKKLLAAARFDPDNLPNGFNRRYATGQGLLPLLCLGGFAGMRTAEIERQLWSDINLERNVIRVTGAKGNTAAKRIIPISPNLKAWLAPIARKEGTCCDIEVVARSIERLAIRAKVDWKHNGLRHSFISYRVAETQNVPQVALESGNSVGMINRHYREVTTAEQAREWFEVAP